MNDSAGRGQICFGGREATHHSGQTATTPTARGYHRLERALATASIAEQDRVTMAVAASRAEQSQRAAQDAERRLQALREITTISPATISPANTATAATTTATTPTALNSPALADAQHQVSLAAVQARNATVMN